MRDWNCISSMNHPECKEGSGFYHVKKSANCPAVQAEPSWHFSPTCIPFKGQDFKECAFQSLPRAYKAKQRQKEPCAQWDVFFSLPLDAFQALLTDSSLLALFPGSQGLGGGLSRGTHFGRKGKGNVFRSSYPDDSLNISDQFYDECVHQGEEGAVLPQKSTDLLSDV